MKKIIILFMSLTLIFALISCSNEKKSNNEYNENLLYADPVYEPLDLASDNNDLFILSTDLLGVYKGVKAAAWDDYDIKLRVKYSDYTIRDFPLKVKNIPIEMRHYLGEVGKHNILLVENKWIVSHDFEIIENPEWDGFTCEFYDKDKKLLSTQKVGYYQEAVYNGPNISNVQEDDDFQYTFVGWNHSTKYINQDMQFQAKYEKLEKRYYASKPNNNDHVGLSALINQDGDKGSGLVYLGRVKHVAALYTETKELDGEDLEFVFDLSDYNKYWNELNENIVKYAITVETDSTYDSSLYGNPYDLINNPHFALQFDTRYQYEGTKCYLEDKTDASLSYSDPYEKTLRRISSYVYPSNIGKVSKDDIPGYYRYAIVLSYDVYLSVSFNYLGNKKYEIGSFNEFIMSPVVDTAKCTIQYSKDGTFESNFDNKLIISSKGLYYAADMISWRKD